jgi:hypothetical protein
VAGSGIFVPFGAVASTIAMITSPVPRMSLVTMDPNGQKSRRS